MGKFFFRFFISAAILLLVFVVLISVLSFFILSKDSVLPKKYKINYSALAVANKKLQNELVYITQLENKNKSTSTNKTEDNLTRKVTFTSDELNALLAVSASGSQTFGSDKRVFSVVLLRLANGVFAFSGSKKIPFITPFGRYINIRSKFKLNVNNSELKFDILSFRVGDIPFPKIIINYFQNREKDTIKNIGLVQELLYSVKSLKVYKDKIVIVYYPTKLLKVVSRLIYPV